MSYHPPPFFARGPAPLVRLTFFVCLSILLMVLDARFRYAETVRQAIAVVAYPLQRIALAPIQFADGASQYFTSLVMVQSENQRLRAKSLEEANDLLILQSLRAENEQLRRLLDARARQPRQSTFAEILYAARDPFSRRVVIDKGAQQGIAPGQAVIDDVGVIGQVTRVYPLMAEVTLLTDKDQSIPVQVVRNGLRAVVFGGGEGGTLELRFMPANADIENGDVLVTSGIDGTYPSGLPVAKVSRIERDSAYAFAKIACVPAAGTDQHRQVLVLSQVPGATAPAPEPAPKAAKARKREDQ